MMRLLFAFLAVFTVLAGSTSARAQDPSEITQMNPGDQVRITVWRKPEMSGDFTVGGNGTILHPLYREVSVIGVPLTTVEERLRTYLTRYETNPQFVIQPLVRIVVGGEVRSPNILSVPPETTIAQAVALGGGPTERGRLDRVNVIREGSRFAST
jgi:polysaccharide export outer membrane protein